MKGICSTGNHKKHFLISNLQAYHTIFFKLLGFFCSNRVWIQGLHLKPLHEPFFVIGFSR
jgi:hypothetical protein